MERGNLILAIGTIKIFVMAGERDDAVKVCDGLLDELIAEINAAQPRLAGGQDERYCPGHAAPVVNGECFECGLPRRPAAKA